MILTSNLPLAAGRYWVFCGGHFKRGGFLDYHGCYMNISECINVLIECSQEGKVIWWHIFDSTRKLIILSNEPLRCIEVEAKLELEDFSGEST